MNWLKKVMAGRYGSDQLSLSLLILSIVLTFIFVFSRQRIFVYISYVPLLICLFRMFSKDIDKRRMENYKFAIFMSPLYSWFTKRIAGLQDARKHKYFTCPSCKQKLRVPRGKGKISITCPKCKKEFIKKT